MKLIRYEIKKLTTPFAVLITILAGFIFIYSKFFVIDKMYFINGLYGKEGIEKLKNSNYPLLTEAKIKEELKILRKEKGKYKPYEIPYYLENEYYLSYITGGYYEFGTFDDLEELINSTKLPDFYKERERAINENLKKYGFSSNTMNSLKEEIKKTNTPIKTGYCEGWEMLKDGNAGEYFMIVLALIVSSIFSREESFDVKSLIGISKEGKTTLYYAKIITAFGYGIFLFLIGNLILFASVNYYYGFEGYDLPIQLVSPLSFKSDTMLTFTLKQLFKELLNFLFISSLALFFSTLSKRVWLGTLMITGFFFIFFSLGVYGGAFPHIAEFIKHRGIYFGLLPVFSTLLRVELEVVPIFGFALSQFLMTVLVNIFCIFIMLRLTKISVKNYWNRGRVKTKFELKF